MSPVANKHRNVTGQRRKLILEAVDYLNRTWTGGHVTAGAVTRQLKQWIAEGLRTWPIAKWPGALQEPYDSGTYQNLQAMERLGLVVWDDQIGWVTKAAPAGQLRHRAADVLRLQSEGKTGVEIAEELGISKSLAYSLLNDPTGEHERERKRSYCPACGAKREPEATTCANCRQKKAEELLPPETYVLYAERARDVGYELAFGVTPDFSRILRVRIGQRILDHELRSDLTWLDGLRELQDDLGVQLLD